jgi:hypothetical protein
MDFSSPQRLKRVGNRTARYRCVFGSAEGYGVWKNWMSFSYVRLGEVGSTVGKIFYVFDFILHTAYTVDACAVIRILPTLSLIDMINCTADTKGTPASVHIFIDIASAQRLKRVGNRIARFRCVFGSTDGHGVWKTWASLRYVQSIRFFRFPSYSSHCIYCRRMRTYQDTIFTLLERYYILYGGP